MRIAEHIMLSALRKGGSIRTFYRRPAKKKEDDARSVIPDGFVLETPGASGDTPLSHTDFEVVRKYLIRVDTWERTVGSTRFGGETWKLRE